MKKLLLLISLLLALTLLVACGSKNQNPDTEDPDQQGEENKGNDEKEEKKDPQSSKLNFGFYTISNAAGKFLGSPEDNKKPITFDAEPKNISVEEANTWTIEPKINAKGELVYVLFCTYDPHGVAEPDKLLPKKGLLRQAYSETNEAQQWIIIKNEDGTAKLINKKNPMFCLVTNDKGEPVLALTEEAGAEANWKIEEKTQFEQFLTWYSADRRVIFQLPKNTIEYSGITPERIQKFVEDTVTIYETYVEFTDFVTYDHIILKAYETEEHIAYVVSGYMCVTADKDFIVEDLKRMAIRSTKHNVNDCSFMMLHEMGHMFDRGQKWSFEGEAMTDIKAAYVLHANPQFVAAPSEFEPATYFDASNITEAYKRLGGSSMNGTAEGYSIYCCAAIFVDIIQNNIKDWDKVKEMYHWYANNIKDIDPAKWYIENNNLPDETKISDQAARLYMFIGKLSEYGETNVMALIDENDFNSMLAKCGG